MLAGLLSNHGSDASPFPNEWKRLSDRDVIAAADMTGFDVPITCDRNMPFPCALRDRRIAVLVLPFSRLDAVLGSVEAISSRLLALEAGRYALLGREGSLPLHPRKPLEGS